MSDDVDGYSVPIKTHLDKPGVEEAKRGIFSLESALEALGNVDLSMLEKGLSSVAKGVGILGVAGVKSIREQTDALLKSTKAGLSIEQYRKWTSTAGQLGVNPDSFMKDMTTLYEDIARLQTEGKLNREKLTALGLAGADISKVINAANNHERVYALIEGFTNSKMSNDKLQVLMTDSVGQFISDLVMMLRARGTTLGAEYGKTTVFNTEGGVQTAAAFNSEMTAALNSLKSIGSEFSSLIAGVLLNPLKDFNAWLRENGPAIASFLNDPTAGIKSAVEKRLNPETEGKSFKERVEEELRSVPSTVRKAGEAFWKDYGGYEGDPALKDDFGNPLNMPSTPNTKPVIPEATTNKLLNGLQRIWGDVKEGSKQGFKSVFGTGNGGSMIISPTINISPVPGVTDDPVRLADLIGVRVGEHVSQALLYAQQAG